MVNVSPCQPTCDDLSANRTCLLKPQEMCVCEKGFVLMDGKCIKPEQCGCVMNGAYYPVGTNFTTNDCSQECACKKSGGDMQCQTKKCHEHATCSFQKDERNCYCNEGLMGDGISSCTDVSFEKTGMFVACSSSNLFIFLNGDNQRE